MTDEGSTSMISFGNFLRFATIEHIIFALPVFAILVMFQYLSLDAFLFLFLPFSALGIPLSAGVSYLIARGASNDLMMNNYRRSVFIACGTFPGQYYGVLLGGLVGYHLWNMTGGIVGTIIFFVIGSLAGAKIAQYLLGRRLAVETVQS